MLWLYHLYEVVEMEWWKMTPTGTQQDTMAESHPSTTYTSSSTTIAPSLKGVKTPKKLAVHTQRRGQQTSIPHHIVFTRSILNLNQTFVLEQKPDEKQFWAWQNIKQGRNKTQCTTQAYTVFLDKINTQKKRLSANRNPDSCYQTGPHENSICRSIK